MWIYKDKEIHNLEDLSQYSDKEPFGFVYRITNEDTGKFYIGKKQIFSKTNKKLGKKEKAALPVARGRTKTKKLVIKETKWSDYMGSNIQLKEDVKNSSLDRFHKEILVICYEKKMLTYWENAMQCNFNVLTAHCYNSNIAGKYFRKDFEL